MHLKTDVKERSNLPEVTLKTSLKDSVLCACVCIESVLRLVSKVFGICFIEAYRHVTTALAYLKGSGAGRVIKQLHILILQIKPKKWVQNPLEYKRCFINVCWVNNWPLKHRLKKQCQCERFLRKCRGRHFLQSLASSHELALNPSPSTYTFHSTERLPRTHGNQAE